MPPSAVGPDDTAVAPATPNFYVPGQYPPEQSLGYAMRKVLSSILSQADARLAQYDLTYVQWLPLYKLSSGTCDPGAGLLSMGKCDTGAALSRELGIEAPTLTRALDRLQAKGLITRERSTQDRRQVHLALTPAGQDVAQHVPPVLAEVLNGHLQGFTHAEWRQLLSLLSRVQANGDRMREAGAADAVPSPDPTDPAAA